MTPIPLRFAALAVATFCSLASATDAGDSHRQPGPSHAKASPLEAHSLVSASGAHAVEPIRPPTVTAVPRTIQPSGGDPRVTLNPQPIPPGRAKVQESSR